MASEFPKRSFDSSGRASPNPPQRQPRRQVEDEPRRHDKTYRRYAAGVERALASFDTTRLEWPDYISALGRLLKAIQSHPQAIDNIPDRDVVAGRLAQCLSPSLPSGVHQKAIEVYSYIFSLIGKETLAHDLHVYLPGLSPVLTFASLTLRPFFLSLIETYIVTLDGGALRPAVKALLLCLLPGLEEENSEEFQRTLQIVDDLKGAIDIASQKHDHRTNISGEEYFWQCLFLAAISSSSRRQGALAFLAKRLPKLGGQKENKQGIADNDESCDEISRLSTEAELVISPEPGLLIRCFAAGLGDDQVLLQRGFLDLLLSNLPLESPVLTQRVSEDDLEHLVGAATSVVARRDMSLNRRLWSWFLGPHASDSNQESLSPNKASSNEGYFHQLHEKTSYFERFGSQPLTNSILKMISQSSTSLEIARPFRICLSLMDRNEIGNRIIPQIFLPAMNSLLRYKDAAKDEDFQEVLRSANSFFDGIESGVIWGQMAELFAQALDSRDSQGKTQKERLGLAKFILEHFNVREEDMLVLHVPLVTTFLVSAINQRQSEKQNGEVPGSDDEIASLAIDIVDRLVGILPDRTKVNLVPGKDEVELNNRSSLNENPPPMLKIREFYFGNHVNFAALSPPLTSLEIANQLLVEATGMLMTNLQSLSPAKPTVLCAKILSALISKLPDCDHPSLRCSIDDCQRALHLSKASSDRSSIPFGTLAAITQVITQSVITHPSAIEGNQEGLSRLITILVEGFWCFLSPSFPKFQLEAVRCIWQLDELMPSSHLIEASLASFLAPVQDSPEDYSPQFESARRFAALWTHSTGTSGSQTKRVNSIWSKHGGTVWDTVVSQETQNYETRLHRPLLLLLDSSNDTDSALAYFLRDWIGTVTNLEVIFDSILQTAMHTAPSGYVAADTMQSTNPRIQDKHQDSRPQCLYYLQHLLRLLKMPSEHMWGALEKDVKLGSHHLSLTSEKHCLLEGVATLCLQVMQERSQLIPSNIQDIDVRLQRTTLTILQLLMRSPAPLSLQKFHIEDTLIKVLMHTVSTGMENSSLQVALLDTLATALELRIFLFDSRERPMVYRNAPSGEVLKALSKVSMKSDADGVSKDGQARARAAAPPELFKCLQAGISASSSLHVMENWVSFLIDVLPLFGDTLFQNMIPMVDCFCSKIRDIFEQLNGIFKTNAYDAIIAPEPALLSLLGGLEFILTTAHSQMMVEEQRKASTKAPEPSQGFLSNVVAGVFSTEQKNRNAVGNTRLTVILCFQDAIKICLSIWAWGGYGRELHEQDMSSMASFGYISQRLRNKARRIMDRMFAVEALECLETLIVTWAQQVGRWQQPRVSTPLSLLHVLDGSRPKYTMPAIFNAIYSRTNPAAIDDGRMSSLTSDITDQELGQFLVEYTQSLDDDAMDEIWTDCMTFLRDVLMNPIPHHNILLFLLLFLVILAEKVGNTNFGEQRKMRRDLSDLFLRLLAAIFTTRSAGSLQEPAQALFAGEKVTNGDTPTGRTTRRKAGFADLVETLNTLLPRLPGVFSDTDRLVSASSNISTNIIALTLHSKSFPENVRPALLHLWLGLTKINAASKIWKKDISDALNHPRFFSSAVELVKDGWMPLLRQWIMGDKDRVSEICSRIFAPTAAGNIFGVGASAARLEADKKTQLNLRRIAILVLAAENDFIISDVQLLEEKITELLHATAASSPSSATRAEVFMLVRALLLKTSPIHLASLWPIVTAELQRAIASALPRSKDYDVYNTSSLLQACKLLDLLLIIAPDDFQMHEWLFITDTIEAVYRPGQWEPAALVDDLAEEMGSSGAAPSPEPVVVAQENLGSKRSPYKIPLLNARHIAADIGKEELVRQIVRPFFAQLSIHVYESTYSMRSPDWAGCEAALLEDIFDDSTMVG